jgi:hypothetical protein
LKASTAKLTGEPPQFETLGLERLDERQIRQLLGYAKPETVEIILCHP